MRMSVCIRALLSASPATSQQQPLGGLTLQWEGEEEGSLLFPPFLWRILASALLSDLEQVTPPSLRPKQDLNGVSSAQFHEHSWSSDCELSALRAKRFLCQQGQHRSQHRVTGCSIPGLSGEQEGAAREGLTTPPPLPWQSLQSSALCNKFDNEQTLNRRLNLLCCAQFI